jgi:hypothetical protein
LSVSILTPKKGVQSHPYSKEMNKQRTCLTLTTSVVSLNLIVKQEQ